MLNLLARKIFGSANDRLIKKLGPTVDKINALEPSMKELDDAAFPVKIAEWKQEVAQGRSLDDLLPEVFALVREAGLRRMNMRHFDTQLIGGMVLHQARSRK